MKSKWRKIIFEILEVFLILIIITIIPHLLYETLSPL